MNSINRYRIARACDFVMFNDDGVKAFGDIITDYKNNLWCKYSDVEQLQARIKELESDAHINEIKAQGISEAIKGFRTFAISNNVNLTCGDFDGYLCEKVNKLRAKHD